MFASRYSVVLRGDCGEFSGYDSVLVGLPEHTRRYVFSSSTAVRITSSRLGGGYKELERSANGTEAEAGVLLDCAEKFANVHASTRIQLLE